MKAVISTILLFSLFLLSAEAQDFQRCATQDVLQIKAQSDNAYLERIKQTSDAIELYARNNSNRFTGEVYRIPVVVHVLYNNDEQNIPDQKIFDQIEVLNQDYRRLNPDASLTRSEFLDVAEDSGIEFYLAEFDPQGNPTNGIVRTQTNQTSFILSLFDGSFKMKHSSEGGSDAWDTNQYMNIWVCNLSIFGIPAVLGFATPPEGAPNWPAGSAAESADEDGVVVHYEVFGPDPGASGTLATVSKGRTATHEVGHYLGLRHIWGDGDCSADDGLQDTPTAAQASQQTCDLNSNSCSDSGNDLPDMIENYMDYSDENCMNMFTAQQVSAMRFVVENFRQDLLLSNQEVNPDKHLKIYPNPVETILNFSIPDNKYEQIVIRDMFGRKVMEIHGETESLDVSTLHSGIYTIEFSSGGNSFVNKFLKR
jgi:hypothetical protein